MGDHMFPLLPLIPQISTHLHSARALYTYSPPVYLYPWVDIPAIAFW